MDHHATASHHVPIFFFDGDCALCSRAVRMLARLDKSRRLYFAPIQGATAKACLPEHFTSSVDTAVLRRFSSTNGVCYDVCSDAILRALALTDSPWRYLAKVASCLPKSVRDRAYQLIAKNRHRLLNSSEQCPLHSAIAQDRILP